MSVTNLSSPLYEIPLEDAELIIMARITVMFGHIDTQIDSIILSLFRLSQLDFNLLFGEKMIGAKIKLIKEKANLISNDEEKKSLLDMCQKLSASSGDRNTMIHGRWGWEWRPEENLYYRCAYNTPRNPKPMLVKTLPELHERVCLAAKLVDAEWHKRVLNTQPPDALNRRWMYSSVGPPTAGPPPPMPR